MIKEQVIEEMKRVFLSMPVGIDHTLHVLNHAETIMNEENVSDTEREITTFAALLHDIGVIEAQRKYDSMEGPYQEKEGAIIARQILEKLGCRPDFTNRVSYIVGHHHTASKIDGLDFQILWDADLLENLKANAILNDDKKLSAFIQENFQTTAGKSLAYQHFVRK